MFDPNLQLDCIPNDRTPSVREKIINHMIGVLTSLLCSSPLRFKLTIRHFKFYCQINIIPKLLSYFHRARAIVNTH